MAEIGAESKPLSIQQHRAIAALLVEKNMRAAAKASNTPERTLWTWCSDPRFMAAVHSAEGAVVAGATRRLLQLSEKAIEALDVVLSDENAGDALRIRAAGMVLDQLLTLRELQNTESRLAALEAALYAKPDA